MGDFPPLIFKRVETMNEEIKDLNVKKSQEENCIDVEYGNVHVSINKNHNSIWVSGGTTTVIFDRTPHLNISGYDAEQYDEMKSGLQKLAYILKEL